MLFDRILLNRSVEDISEKYCVQDGLEDKWSVSTVQRNTASLARLLNLPLPDAPHKKHRH